MSYVKDSGVSFRGDDFVFYHYTRHLYFPLLLSVFPDKEYPKFVAPVRLSGCMLKRCKFPTITCNNCAFEY